MSGLGGLAAGALGLAVLETLLSTGNAQRLAGVFGAPAVVARYLIDPSVPGIPDHSRPAAAAVTATTGGTTAARPSSPTGPTGPDTFRLLPDPAPPARRASLIPGPSRPSAVPIPSK